jgi:hypothetical protein
MPTILVCRTCGNRNAAELAENQRELASVGMLEQACDACGKATFWVLAENVRRKERRGTDRRQKSVPVSTERRQKARRGAERRARL